MLSIRLATLILLTSTFAVASPLHDDTDTALSSSAIHEISSLFKRSACDGPCVINTLSRARASLAPILKNCQLDRAADTGPAKCVGDINTTLRASAAHLQMSARGTYSTTHASKIASLLLSTITSINRALSPYDGSVSGFLTVRTVDTPLSNLLRACESLDTDVLPLMHSRISGHVADCTALGFKLTLGACGY